VKLVFVKLCTRNTSSDENRFPFVCHASQNLFTQDYFKEPATAS